MRNAVYLFIQKLRLRGMLSNPCECPKSVDFHRICFPSLFLEELLMR